MVHAEALFDAFTREGVRFFTGVPDSLLKEFCACVSDSCDKDSHVIAANEGNAVALATGHHLATGKTAVVYLQNSGIGNAINPLLSLADPSVYGIPMLLVIGWRGEPGKKDEPQHQAQGPLTVPLLATMKIPYKILPTSERAALSVMKKLYAKAKNENRPVALVVREGTFSPRTVAVKKPKTDARLFTREDALHVVVPLLPAGAIVVSTTGKLSREIFEFRKEKGAGHDKDFLTVGSMGHASQIALGIALFQKERQVYCFDGDGAAIMHLGGWAVVGQTAPKNFKHIVFNNGAHESVGGQLTAGYSADFKKTALSCGYANAVCVSNPKNLRTEMLRLKKMRGPALLEIRIGGGSRSDLGRPTRSPAENKRDFMRYVKRAPRT